MSQKIMELSRLLTNISEALDIPETRYIEACNRYEAVGKWLSADKSHLQQYSPEIYAQGSFALGTVVKPITDKDEYDIDLVCFLADLDKSDTSQAELKRMVGQRLKENEIYNNIVLPEGKRCWILDYANEFHMDILPSIADIDFRQRGGYCEHAILITDQEKIREGGLEWLRSNPKGYAAWFRKCQEKTFHKSRLGLMEAAHLEEIEDVPEYRVRTLLQRVIQLLKRHRDVYFDGKDHKPISMIITTLATKAYEDNDEKYLYQALSSILQNMPNYISQTNGKYEILNPVNEKENFADKWSKNPELPKAFFEWHDALVGDFINTRLADKDLEQSAEILKDKLGAGVLEKVYASVKKDLSYSGPIIVKSKPVGRHCIA